MAATEGEHRRFLERTRVELIVQESVVGECDTKRGQYLGAGIVLGAFVTAIAALAIAPSSSGATVGAAAVGGSLATIVGTMIRGRTAAKKTSAPAATAPS